MPEIVVVERAGQAIGFLATRVSRNRVSNGLSVRERTLLVTHDHDRVNLVAGPDDEVAVADAVAAELLRRGGPSALDIAGLQVGAPLHRALHRRARASRLWTSYDIAVPSYCSVPVQWHSVAGYFHAMAKTMRSNVSRQTRRLFAAGDVELLRADGARDTAPLLPAYLDLEQRSWKFAAHAGILRSPKRTGFFSEVVSGRAAYTPSMVGVALDGVLIAGLLLGRFGSGMWALEMAFDEQHRELGAGQVLLVLAMAEAIRRGATSLGYLQHFAYFKKRWLAQETEVVSTRVVRRGSPVHVRHVLAEAERWRRNHRRAEPTLLSDGDPRSGDSGTDAVGPKGSLIAEHGAVSGRPTRFADAEQVSRQLLVHGCRPGVRLDRAGAEELLPFPLR